MKHYLLVIWRDVEPVLMGPYKHAAERDRDAKRRHQEDPDSSYYRLSAEGKVSVEAFSGKEMEH